MMSITMLRLAIGLCAVSAGLSLLLGEHRAGRADSASPGFTLAGSPSGTHTALRGVLKVLHGWIDDRDYDSAAATAAQLEALARLHAYHFAEPAWRQKSSELAQACRTITAAAQAKDAVACEKGVAACDALVEELATQPANTAKAADKDFKPFGGLKTWMLLMDGAYADAKSARSTEELRNLAQAIADEVHAVAHLRSDAAWRQAALEVKTAALAAAEFARGADLKAAKVELKKINARCEACHEGFKR